MEQNIPERQSGGESTRERILTQALALFAQRGYAGASVEDIAQAVGIRAPSLYKHFKSKGEIFSTLVEEVRAQVPDPEGRGGPPGPGTRPGPGVVPAGSSLGEPGAGCGSIRNPALVQAEAGARAARAVSQELLWALAQGDLEDALADPRTCQLRRLLILEQYAQPELGELCHRRWVEGPLAAHQALFAAWTEGGLLRRGDPRAMAVQFLSPVLLAVGRCDRAPQEREQAEEELRGHVHLFYRIFVPRPNPAQPPLGQGRGRLFRR